MKIVVIVLGLLTLSLNCQNNGVFTDLNEALKTPSKVVFLRLNGCNSIGNIENLEKLSGMTNIESLEISECPMVKAIPNCITSLTKLKKIAFFWNSGQDSTLNWDKEFDKIVKLKGLEILELGPYNNIGDLSPKICSLKKLKILNLRMTNTLSLPKDIVNLENLEELDLSMTQIESLPKGMSKMKNLKKLDLIDTPISRNDSIRNIISIEFKDCKVIW